MRHKTHEIMELCLLAGKIMLQSGAETYRVEDTMTRIAKAFSVKDPHSFVTPTGIFFSVDGEVPAKLFRISDRSTDLEKVAIVNSISRRISSGELSISAAINELKIVEKANHSYPVFVQIGAAALASGCFLLMFKGQWHDFFSAFITGGVGFSAMVYLHHIIQIKFFAEFFASLLIGLVAYLFVLVEIGYQLDKIIIGSVMPLVPGLMITNSVRDLMAGHLVSGISKGAEAFLTSFAIGTGIALIFAFL